MTSGVSREFAICLAACLAALSCERGVQPTHAQTRPGDSESASAPAALVSPAAHHPTERVVVTLTRGRRSQSLRGAR